MPQGRRADLTGRRFGRLTAISFLHSNNSQRKAVWLFRCECGKEKGIDAGSVIRSLTRSCGCLNRETGHRKEQNIKHGFRYTLFYKKWKGMKERCKNKNLASYVHYGGRGISFYPVWESFESFKDDMYTSFADHVKEFGESNTSLERIDVNGNYSKENCRWATLQEQNRNKRNTHQYGTGDKCLAELAEEYRVPYQTLYKRIKAGWDLARSLNTPVRLLSKA